MTSSMRRFCFSLTHELREDFDTALQGNNLKEADLKTLTGGARIANIFRERFPFELIKVLTITACLLVQQQWHFASTCVIG
jgi:hypothetical protein